MRFVSSEVNVLPALPMPGSSAEELVEPRPVQSESHYIILALNWTVCQHKRSSTSSHRIALSLQASALQPLKTNDCVWAAFSTVGKNRKSARLQIIMISLLIYLSVHVSSPTNENSAIILLSPMWMESRGKFRRAQNNSGPLTKQRCSILLNNWHRWGLVWKGKTQKTHTRASVVEAHRFHLHPF